MNATNFIREFEFGTTSGVTKTISGFKVYASSDEGLTGSSANTSGCTLTLYGNSVDNTGTATNLGSMTGLNFRTNSATHIKLSGLNVSTAYQYHWIKFTVPNLATMFCAELEFYEGDTITDSSYAPEVIGKVAQLHGWAVNY